VNRKLPQKSFVRQEKAKHSDFLANRFGATTPKMETTRFYRTPKASR